MIVEGILCIRFVHMCVTDSVVCKCVLVKEESSLPIVLCCVMKMHCILWECCEVLTAIPNVFLSCTSYFCSVFTRTCIFPLFFVVI